jgi:hypothetical protein
VRKLQALPAHTVTLEEHTFSSFEGLAAALLGRASTASRPMPPIRVPSESSQPKRKETSSGLRTSA